METDLLRRVSDRFRIASFALLAAWLFAGCNKPDYKPGSPQFAAKYGELPRLSKTANLKLRRHWNRIKNAQRPSDIQADAPSFSELITRQNRTDAKPPATPVETLASLFTRNKATRLREQTTASFPKHFPPWPKELRELSRVRIRDEDARVAFAKAIRLEGWNFGHRFTHGLLADTSYVDYVQAASYLELFHAIEMLRRDRLGEALPSVESVLLAARRLAEVGHPTPRLAAADLHERAVWVLHALVAHPSRTEEQLKVGLELVHQQIDAWPAEERVWIGEQADGLHTYELIRAGYIRSVLDESELRRIDEEIGFDNFVAAIRKNIDRDQLFYLDACQLTIEASREPYSQRLGVFAALVSEMDRLRQTEEHPRIADWVMLPHIQMGHRAFALDKARFHALALALSETLGVKPRQFGENPLTGKPYRAQHDEKTIRIFDVGPPADDEPVIIPRLARLTSSRSG